MRTLSSSTHLIWVQTLKKWGCTQKVEFELKNWSKRKNFEFEREWTYWNRAYMRYWNFDWLLSALTITARTWCESWLRKWFTSFVDTLVLISSRSPLTLGVLKTLGGFLFLNQKHFLDKKSCFFGHYHQLRPTDVQKDVQTLFQFQQSVLPLIIRFNKFIWRTINWRSLRKGPQWEAMAIICS